MRDVQTKTVETRPGEHESVGLTLAHLADASVDVAPDLHGLQVRAPMQELGAAPEAGGSDYGILGEAIRVIARVGDESISRIVALGDRREDYTLRDLRRHILRGVYGQVDIAGQERFVELACEDVALVYNGERHVRVVLAGGFDGPDFDFETRFSQPFGASVGLR